MNRTHGKASWSPPQAGQKKEDGKKTPFLSMKDYNKVYKVRVLSDDPMRYWCHWTKNHEGKNVKVNCTLNKNCPVVDDKTQAVCAGNTPQSRYYLKVLDREDGTIKLLDIGIQIVNGIGELIKDEDYGHPKDYDIKIKKGVKGAMPLYTVLGAPKRKLTKEEMQLIKNSDDSEHEDFIDIEGRCKPYKLELVNKIVFGEDIPTTKKEKEVAEDESEDDAIDWE